MTTQNFRIMEVAMEVALPKSTLDQIASNWGPQKAREAAMSTSVGGIGPLLRERIFSQGEMGLDVIGVTLLYDSVWVQSYYEWGQIHLQKKKIGDILRQSLMPTELGFDLTFFNGQTKSVKVWKLDYGQVPVYFLDVPEINGVVYPGPKDAPPETKNPPAWSHELRLLQGWLIGRGSLALSKNLNRKPHLTVMSETPAFFSHHQLVKDDYQKDSFFDESKYIFNDHTPLEYAHPLWDHGTLDLVKVDESLYLNTPAWLGDKKLLDVTSLLVGVCNGVFGVARKHEEVMRKMDSLKEYSHKIKSITNGVRLKDWQDPDFQNFKELSDEQLIEIKDRKKNELLDWAWRRFRLYPNWVQEARQKKILLWTRRITPYKRLDILGKLFKKPDLRARFLACNVIFFVGGRIHQQDDHAQDIVFDLLDLINHDEELSQQIIFVDNFNVWEAPQLFRGADGAIMISDDTREASATGFMKAQMNGGAVISTADGAVPEFVKFFPAPQDWPHGKKTGHLSYHGGNPELQVNGFEVPYLNNEPTSEGFLNAIENFVNEMNVPEKRIAIMRSALSVSEFVSVDRTVRETMDLYGKVIENPALPVP